MKLKLRMMSAHHTYNSSQTVTRG